MDLLIIAPIAGLSAIVFAGYLTSRILKKEKGTARMKEISSAIHRGAMAYLKRQYKTIAIFAAVLAGILGLSLGPFTALAFVMGAISSALAGCIGMSVAVRANVRTTHAAKTGLNDALVIAFRGGAVTGMLVVGLALLGIYFLYAISGDPFQMVGFGFGASLVGLFARVGGGIYTKGADIGADLVGKIEVGIPEDDPRNPGVIADLVGDNVGDVAGMGADLFESYVGSVLAAMLIGAIGAIEYGRKGVVFPLLLLATGVFSTILGTFLVRASKGTDPIWAINKGTFTAGILATIMTYILVEELFGELNLFYAALVGLTAAIFLSLLTQYYTSPDKPPAQEIAKSSQTGPATNIITGLAVGMRSTALPVIVVCGAILLAYTFAGMYGIAIATMGMNLITGMVIAMDSFGPIVDNAGGIAEMAGSDPKVREVTDALDSVGNTTKAVCKGFAISACAFETTALFLVYMFHAKIGGIGLTEPSVIIGLFVGGALAFLFSSLCLKAVGITAFQMIEEIRRQFREIPGLKEREAKPDYARCVDISTRVALKSLLVPGILAMAVPLIIGFTLGPEAVGGLLVGNIVSALALAMMMAHSGTAWDNAKKLIEAGHLGGKGTPTHAAAVVGDTIGDPFKDTAGPSLDVLMTILSTISILFAELFTMYTLFA